jgi:calcineurin-like phosphoesterase family protein
MIETCKEAGVKNFIFLGDMLDRGEDALGTVKTLLEIKDISTFIMGNHDWKFVRHYYGRGVSLAPEQAATVELFKANGDILKDFCDLFYQEWVALLDEDQKVMLSHAPGYRPAKFCDRYKKNELGKNDYARLLYGISMGDTENGRPIRMRMTQTASDDLDGWMYFYGHIHADSIYSEPASNMRCLDLRAGETNGVLGAWVIGDTVRNGKLLVINQQGEASWNSDAYDKPFQCA